MAKKEAAKKVKTTDTALDVSTAAEMKTFLTNVRDKLVDGTSPPVYALTALNTFLQHSSIYELLTPENKELARDIWLRIKQAGFQIKNPPLLFDEEDVSPAAAR